MISYLIGLKRGAVRTVGIILERGRDWRLVVGNTALLGGFAIFFASLFGLISRNMPMLYGSVIVIGIGGAILLYLRLGGKIGIYDVEWSSTGGTQGTLEISFKNPKGKIRAGLIVDKVEARPTEPLFTTSGSRYNPIVPVPGTKSSILITFRNERRIALGLGFSNVEDMNKVYEELK